MEMESSAELVFNDEEISWWHGKISYSEAENILQSGLYKTDSLNGQRNVITFDFMVQVLNHQMTHFSWYERVNL